MVSEVSLLEFLGSNYIVSKNGLLDIHIVFQMPSKEHL